MYWNTENNELASTINQGVEYQNGDVLDATSLNATISEVLTGAELLGTLFGSAFIALLKQGFAKIEWSQQAIGVYNQQKYQILLGEFPIYAVAQLDASTRGNFHIEVATTNQMLTIEVKDSAALNQYQYSGTLQYALDIEFYLDAAHTKLITKRKLPISYLFRTTGPTD